MSIQPCWPKSDLAAPGAVLAQFMAKQAIRDCAIIIRRGDPKTRGGALHKIAAKIGGAQSKINHLTEGGGGLKFYSKCKKN